MSDEYLTVEEVASLLKSHVSFVYQNWPAWMKFGVKPMKLNGPGQKGRLRFKKSQIVNMVEKAWAVTAQ